MKYSICIDALFKGTDFIKAMKTVKACGMDTIEFWLWTNKDLDSIIKAKNELDMKIVGCCTKEFDLVNPSKRDIYLDGLRESVEVAKRLGVDFLITQVGEDTGESGEAQKQSIIDGLKCCVPILEKSGMTLLIEPLNAQDHPSDFLRSSEAAFDIVRAVGSDYVKVLFDIYHQQITEGNLLYNIKKNIDFIGHFHAAGNPGRNELNKGEIHYKNIFRELEKLHYEKYIGFEFFPEGSVECGIKESLGVTNA